jgi:hydroxymethylpyrimidine pyrophosphatase-like HAD family hydrolase
MALVCFDVDGTLLQNAAGADVPRPNIIALLKLLSKKGNKIIVWSGGGAEYARMQATRLHLDEYIFGYASKNDAMEIKPYLAIDDQVVNLGKYNIRV